MKTIDLTFLPRGMMMALDSFKKEKILQSEIKLSLSASASV